MIYLIDFIAAKSLFIVKIFTYIWVLLTVII